MHLLLTIGVTEFMHCLLTCMHLNSLMVTPVWTCWSPWMIIETRCIVTTGRYKKDYIRHSLFFVLLLLFPVFFSSQLGLFRLWLFPLFVFSVCVFAVCGNQWLGCRCCFQLREAWATPSHCCAVPKYDLLLCWVGRSAWNVHPLCRNCLTQCFWASFHQWNFIESTNLVDRFFNSCDSGSRLLKS